VHKEHQEYKDYEVLRGPEVSKAFRGYVVQQELQDKKA
jgi:hypothetical protein